MAQLKDDCFAFGGGLMPLDEALDLLSGRMDIIAGTEAVPVTQALGRILVDDLIAERAVPPHDNSAVDGYAVFFEDLNPEGDTVLPVGGRVAAGHPLGRPAERGEAIRIFTGAAMPQGPDTIFMEEDATPDGDKVILPKGLKQGSNRRFAGEDVNVGDVVVPAGQVLRPQDLGLAASVGAASLILRKRLKAAIFSTGDEICDLDRTPPEGCVYDANRYSVRGLLEGLGLEVTDLGILPDDQSAIEKALGEAARTHDVLLTSGGVSAGEEDHVKAAVEAQGSLHFWRLAIKPGRPIALGQIDQPEGHSTAFIGLPGNPVAAMVTFIMIARPLLMALAGARPDAPKAFPVFSGFDGKKKSGRREWLRARLEVGEDGTLRAVKFRSSGAGILTSMSFADGLVELPEDVTRIAVGDPLSFLPFSELM
ncbi:MAG: gephyrin-like molybdotransferase Glp [Magnetovibrionaceae bacterium]